MESLFITPKKFESVVEQFQNTSILVIGDIMVDEYLFGDVHRISPEAPVPIVGLTETSLRLGGASNVVSNLNRLGIHPVLISVCGNDFYGEQMRSMLTQLDHTTDYICFSNSRPTTVKTRVLARHQQIVRLDRETTSDLSEHECEFVVKKFEEVIDSVNAVIVSDYAKGVICQSFMDKIIPIVQRKNKFIAVDPREKNFHLYKGVSVVTPNLKEAHAGVGLPYCSKVTDEHIQSVGKQLLTSLDLEFLLLTLSEKGLAIFGEKGELFHHLPTEAKEVFDVTGAGDTVISVFTAAYICGATPLEAAYIANHAAGLTVAELGTASVSVDELRKVCFENK